MSVIPALQGPALGHPVGACLLAAVAWWTASFVHDVVIQSLPPSLAPLALGIAAVAGFGLVGFLAWREAPASRDRSGPRGLRARDLLGLALLVPAYPLGAALQRAVRAALHATPQTAAFGTPSETLVAAMTAAPLLTLLVAVLVVPVAEEAFFRGLLLPSLVRKIGARGGLLLVSAISATALAGERTSAREWIAVAVCACFWSLLLGIVRLATGSVAAPVLLRAGLVAAWSADLLLGSRNGAAGIALPLLSAASVCAGVWFFRRGVWGPVPRRAGDHDEPAVDRAPVHAEAADEPRRIRFPTVGVAVGAGMLVAECVVVLHGLLESFAGGGIWIELSLSIVSYMAVGAILDLGVQLLPGRLGRSRILRALPVIAVVFAAEHRFGAWSVVAYGVAPVAAIWAWAAHVRWARPLAGAMALIAIASALPARATPRHGPSASPPRGAPSFVVVVLDTVRRDHCSLYGYSRKTTPNLDALASRGARFDRAYSASCWSVESHASLFTGLLPHAHGATFEHTRLAERHPTIASVLAAKGWDTAAFSGNPYVTDGTGMARGFSVFMDLWRPFVMRRGLVAMQVGASMGKKQSDKGGSAVVAQVRRWIAKRDASRPYFLFVNLMEAHSPYQDAQLYSAFTDPALTRVQLELIGRESHDAQWMGSRVKKEHLATTLDLLDGATTSADAYLGEILAAVGKDANVVVLSDHGDLVGEHDLYGHMTGLYEPLIHVPLVMAGPDVPPGISVSGPISTVDIMPTLLSMAKVTAPTMDGTDFSSVLRGAGWPADRPIVAEHYRNPGLSLWSRNRSEEEIRRHRARRMAVVIATKKRVVAEDGSDLGYDLSTDADELRPVPGASTGIAATVPPAPGPSGAVELDPAQVEMLKSLGYVNK